MNVGTSAKGSDDNRPAEENCLDCHDAGRKEIGSVQWDMEPQARSLSQKIESGLKFSHKAHLGRGLKCAFCHDGTDAAQGAVQSAGMDGCFRCHEDRRRVDDCAICHSEVGILRPADHDMSWINHHMEDARMGDDRCGTCHGRTTARNAMRAACPCRRWRLSSSGSR